ncbi:MAG: hypothetical protein RBT28_03575, partial [Bacteroidales bacterium]|nr:hypothetical protein [Bacteroidales bacterium]
PVRGGATDNSGMRRGVITFGDQGITLRRLADRDPCPGGPANHSALTGCAHEIFIFRYCSLRQARLALP